MKSRSSCGLAASKGDRICCVKGRTRMRLRLFAAVVVATVIASPGATPADAANRARGAGPHRGPREDMDAGAHAVGRARPAGHVLEPDDHAVRAPGQRRGTESSSRRKKWRRSKSARRGRAATRAATKARDADVSRAYNDFWWDRGTKVTTTAHLAGRRSPGWTRARADRGREETRRRRSEAARVPRHRRERPRHGHLARSQPLRAVHHARDAGGDESRRPTTTTTGSRRARATSPSRSRCSAARA